VTARPIDPAHVADTPTRTLLRLYAATLTELLRRGVIRTRNAPAGDLAELLVARAYRGELASNAEKSWDVRAADGRLLQVKCRVVSAEPKRGQLGLSPFRSFDFDAVVIVLLDEESYAVAQAVELPVGVVEENSRHVRLVNGFRLHATPSLFARAEAIDVTDVLGAALESLDGAAAVRRRYGGEVP
jgi:hypothetical protein